jgi:large-conductance mechanosensitive channel
MDSTLKVAIAAAVGAVIGSIITAIVAPHINWHSGRRRKTIT